MDIEQELTGKKGAFFVADDGTRLAELLFFRSAPDLITIYHTEVNEKLRGKGAGADMVAAAVKYAHENGLKIVAECPYAKKMIERNPEFRSILAESEI